MYRGAAYADSLQYQHCIDLWKYALELRVDKDTILYCDTCFTAQALVKLYLDLYEKNTQGLLATQIRLEDVVSTVELLVRDLPECAALLEIAPQFRRQLDSYDKVSASLNLFFFDPSTCGLYYKSFTIVSDDCNDSVQCYKTFYHRKLQNFAMS